MTDQESGLLKVIDGAVEVATKYRLLQKLVSLFIDRKAVVLLCGTSGVGKSQFIRSLEAAAAAPIQTTARTRGWRRVNVKKDGRKLELLDTPGQVGDGPIRRKAYLEALKQRRFGIVNVVANGYHEGTASEREAVIKSGGRYKVRPEYQTACRGLEISSLDEWSIELLDAKWLVTLVNKADLWWYPDTYQSVLTQYRTGPYAGGLRSWQGKHVVLPYASTYKPFYDRMPMSGYFGAEQRLECQITALKELSSLIEQSKSG